MNEDYHVKLDIYNGPLDLLLYLIRKEEVDIYDIPIAKIADQYTEYVKMLQQLDPNLAGEFLVLAATLMEIKSKMLLPHHESEEADEEPIDPRSELISRLLEYKQFKDAAKLLQQSADRQAEKFPRVPVLSHLGGDEIELEDLQIWDLVEAFSKLMEATLGRIDLYQIESDDTPLAIYQEQIIDILKQTNSAPFSKIFEGRNKRTELIGLFLAVLELIRQGIVKAEQDKPFGEIYLILRVDIPECGDNGGGSGKAEEL